MLIEETILLFCFFFFFNPFAILLYSVAVLQTCDEYEFIKLHILFITYRYNTR